MRSEDPVELELSIVMPCLNEVATLERCIEKARGFLDKQGIAGEIVIADNGSSDGSQDLARRLRAVVVDVPERGYGNALMGGIGAARGRFVIMGDADESYDFSALQPFVDKLREGFQLVMGNRFRGGIAPGAMPALHRYLGNPVLSAIGRLFFGGCARDFHCGLRGFERQSILVLQLRTTGMEFASEMVVKSHLRGLRIAEVPTTLSPDGRDRAPHLRSWRDGWRHLRFLLLYSPRWLFLYPGAALMLIGLLVGGWVLPGPRPIGRIGIGANTLLYAAGAVAVGFQSVVFAVFSKTYAIEAGLLPRDPRLAWLMRFITLETGLLVGTALLGLGFAGSLAAVYMWSAESFGELDLSQTIRWVVPSVLALILGSQTILSSFFLSLLGLRQRSPLRGPMPGEQPGELPSPVHRDPS